MGCLGYAALTVGSVLHPSLCIPSLRLPLAAALFVSILVSAAATLVQAQETGPESTVLSEPRIVLVSPIAQRLGRPVSIEVQDVDSAAIPVVTFDGVPATNLRYDLPESGDGLLTVEVPTSLDEANASPVIRVELGPYRLRYEGPFDVVIPVSPSQETVTSRTALVFIALVLLLFAAGVIAVALAVWRRVGRVEFRSAIQPAPEFFEMHALGTDALPELEPPRPPPELLAALAAGECVVVVGSGVSAQAGLPTWTALLESIARQALDSRDAQHITKMLIEGRVDEAADSLAATLETGELARRVVATAEFLQPASHEVYDLLAQIAASAFVSLNLDGQLAAALGDRAVAVAGASGADRCLDAFAREELFVLNLNGSVSEPQDLLLSYQALKDAVAANDLLRDLLRRFYYSRTLLFIGVSLGGVQNFLRLIERTATAIRKHYALVEVNDARWEYTARSLSQLGLHVLPFNARDRHRAFMSFLEEVAEPAAPRLGQLGSGAVGKITRVQLRNIGPFEECVLDLDPHWTVLLGDNGVGKSTILRAIAVCLCGKSSEPFAGRLLRSGAATGEIVLHFGERTYVATISARRGGGVAVDAPSGVPLELESVLAVGYAALRTAYIGVGSEKTAPWRRPAPRDLLPLISDEPDTRLSPITEWIVRLDHLRSSSGIRVDDSRRYEALFREVFATFQRLADGLRIEPGNVDPKTGEISVVTSDGTVPFQSLSQGTLSLISWTGDLLQRLYETSPAGTENPRNAPAIVLIDEIDAHMHPWWQQTLVRNLQETFPNVQFIATSHSPLVVSSLEPTQVYRLERNRTGRVVIERPEHSLKGLGAAGLLTSNLFGLQSQLDIDTAESLERKRRLTAKDLSGKLTADERKELDDLDREVGDIDFTRTLRDPLYTEFVNAMSKIEAEAETAEAGYQLSAAERERKAKLAERIVRQIKPTSEEERVQ